MSAAFQLPMEWDPRTADTEWRTEERRFNRKSEARQQLGLEKHGYRPPENLAFYRKHTQCLLRRYLYASTQVGRAPSILGDSVGRGWASSRPVRTFEDALIFVLDIEGYLDQLEVIDRELISRVVLQDYTYEETAALLGVVDRTVRYRVPLALDRLTEKLLAADLLAMPF